jgi:hypothetical protein
MKRALAIVALLAAMALAAPAGAQRSDLAYRWFYASANLHKREGVARTVALFARAQAAGYNGMLFNGIDGHDRSEAYAKNVREVQAEARRHGIEMIPAMLAHNDSSIMNIDPNLAEGLPVKEARFVVKGREAHIVTDPVVTIAGAGFEEAKGDAITGWELQDATGVSSFWDGTVAHSGHGSARVEELPKAEYGRVRFSQSVKVQPFRQYRFRVWVKTEGYTGGAGVMILAPTEQQRNLADEYLPIKSTQGWTRHDVVVNSLNFDHLQIYLVSEGGGKGRIWWDDVSLEEIGIHNILRREGTPLTVRGEDGTVYEEGRDFAPVRDPKLAAQPTLHEPLPIRLTPNSRIPEGASLRVSYYHPLFLAGYVVSCLSEPRVYEILKEELEGVNALLHPKIFFMYDDEMRIGNWDESCLKRNLTPGQMLADKVRKCIAMIRAVRPDAEIWDWSDMFDPMHNATGDCYAVNGSWAGSWEGLTPDIGIVNWGNHLNGANLKWFADRGHKQILAGYYDGSGYPIDKWLQAGAGLPGIVGAMYTTWVDHYDDLESWAEQAWGKADAPRP